MKIGDYKNASKMFLKAREFAEKERKKDLINSIELFIDKFQAVVKKKFQAVDV